MKKLFVYLCLGMFLLCMPGLVSAQEEGSVRSRVKRSFTMEDAPLVALYVYLDPTGVSDPVKSSEVIFNGVQDELDKTNKVNVISFDRSQKIWRNYIRENSSAETARESDWGFIPKKKDLIALGDEAQADYVLYINARVTDRKANFSWPGISAQQTIVIEVLLFDKTADEYIIDEMCSETGKGSWGNFDRAFNKALPKLLDQVDLSTVDFKKAA